MAIDTVTKRKSVINQLPGLALLPPPDAVIAAVDRRRLADLYALIPQTIARNFWVPDERDTVGSWSGDQRSSVTGFWVPDEDSDGTWKEETEVPAE